MYQYKRMQVEVDLLQHLAKCPLLEELDVDISCAAWGRSDCTLEVGPASVLLHHLSALEACTRLRSLRIDVQPERATAMFPCEEMFPGRFELEDLRTALPALKKVGGLNLRRYTPALHMHTSATCC